MTEVKAPKPTSLYTLELTQDQSDALADWCETHGWAFYEVNYGRYAYKSDRVNVVVYNSGKCVVQGKGTEAFVTEVLELEITKDFKWGMEQKTHPEWFKPHAGMDESGKGDLFGPLVAACVIADGPMVESWLEQGLKESKQVSSDARLFALEKLVRQTKGVVVEVVYARMEKYNQLYARFGNLNNLLGWFHAKALSGALQRRPVPFGVLDQFSRSQKVLPYLNVENFILDQHVRAESDPVVAAASIVARAEFVRQLQNLSREAGIPLPKGAGPQAQEVLAQLVEKLGKEALPCLAKMHFKNINQI